MCMSGQSLSKRSQHWLSQPWVGDESSKKKLKRLRKKLVHGPKAANNRSSLQLVTAWRKYSATLLLTEPEKTRLAPSNHAELAQFLRKRLLDPSGNPLVLTSWDWWPCTSKYCLRSPAFPGLELLLWTPCSWLRGCLKLLWGLLSSVIILCSLALAVLPPLPCNWSWSSGSVSTSAVCSMTCMSLELGGNIQSEVWVSSQSLKLFSVVCKTLGGSC